MPKPASGQTQQNEYYFDSKYLQQYLSQNAKLKVLVNGGWLDIADESDLRDESTGVGYDTSGKAHFIDYREIQSIKAAGRTVTLDQLNQEMSSQQSPEEEQPQDAGEEEPTPDQGGAEDAEEEPASPDDEEEAPPEEETPKKGPQKASYDPYMIGRRILTENSTKKNPYVGQFVQIVDIESMYHGKKGSVSGVSGDLLEIRIYNSKTNRVETVYSHASRTKGVL